jgi:hypothetical protein
MTDSKDQKNKATAADPSVMMRATGKANSAKGYFYGGNLGDSIETRLPEGSFLGGGNDYFDGQLGTGNSWLANGPGIYGGTGLINGAGRMFSSIHSGSAGGFQYLRNFSSNSNFNHLVIAACEAAYLQSGIVQSVIDLYADFATEDLEIYHPDKSVANFYNIWAKKVNLKSRVHDLFLNLFTMANVFVYRNWAVLGAGDKRAMKRAESARIINDELTVRVNDKDRTVNPKVISKESDKFVNKKVSATPPTIVEETLPDNPDKKIPWGYTFLNPVQMDIRGSRIQNQHHWVMLLDKKDTKDLINSYNNGNKVDLAQTQINLPKELKGRLKRTTKNTGYFMELRLDENELNVVHRPGKFDWFAWGVPFVYPALKPLMFKDCLVNMEMKMCQAAMNMLYLFKLGNLKEGFPAEDEHFERFADMLQMPSNVGYMIWNDLVEGEILQPDLTNAFDKRKHETAREDILLALGVPEVLIGGKGSNFSNAFIAVAGVLEKLEAYRGQVADWLMGEMKLIADAMGFRRLPEIKFGRTSLTDERSRQQFLLQLYDRNIISADTVLNEADTDVDTEKSKKSHEKEATKKGGVMERKGPFDKPEPKPAVPGRPNNSNTGPTGEQKKKRQPKGINIASTLDMYDKLNIKAQGWLNQIESFCSKKMIQKYAKAYPDAYSRISHVKQLKKQDRERLEQLIYNIFSNISPEHQSEQLEDEFIVGLLQSDAAGGVKKEVSKIYHDKIMDYKREFGKMPSKDERRKIMSSAYTQFAILGYL